MLLFNNNKKKSTRKSPSWNFWASVCVRVILRLDLTEENSKDNTIYDLYYL